VVVKERTANGLRKAKLVGAFDARFVVNAGCCDGRSGVPLRKRVMFATVAALMRSTDSTQLKAIVG
jgi:hypothetical protein